MPGAVIVVDQPSGAGSGVAGTSRQDLWLSQAIQLSVGTSGNGSYLWELLDKPPGSSASLSTPTASTSAFTPDVIGSYRIRLITNGGGAGNLAVMTVRVRFTSAGGLANRGWAIPAIGEQGLDENNYAGNTRGYDEAIRFILNDLKQLFPTGAEGQAQFQKDGLYVGSPKLVADTTSLEITHLGAPTHKESVAHFQDPTSGSSLGEAQSRWKSFATANATPVIVQSISVPITDWGDCFITVTWEITVAAASGGGNIAHKATFRRNSGTLALVNDSDNTNAANLQIAASVAADVADNNTIKLTGTGIAAAVNWVISTHVQIAKKPS